MSPEQIIRAWKMADDDACRPRDAEVGPPNPVGPIALSDAMLDMSGGSIEAERTEYLETLGCCQGFTQYTKCDVTAAIQVCTTLCITIWWSHFDWCQ